MLKDQLACDTPAAKWRRRPWFNGPKEIQNGYSCLHSNRPLTALNVALTDELAASWRGLKFLTFDKRVRENVGCQERDRW
jgi:hypothetical protein